jgi:NADH dehydrogenase
MTEAAPHRIVVVGGGAGGLELATKLGDGVGRDGRARVTLVDRSRTHIWKPLLHSIAAGSLRRSQHELNYIAQAHWRNFRYRNGEMIGLDRAARTIALAATLDEEGREITPPSSLAYDTLVVAVGSVTNDFGTPGAKQFAVPLETPEQASRFNRRLVNACLRAQYQEGPVRPGQLHVAIIGAGATGTELAAELHHTARAIIAYGLDRIDPERDLRIVLIEAADRILPALPPRISGSTQDLLVKMGVEVRTGARVAEVLADGVRLADGEIVPSELVVWSAGVKAPPFLAEIDGLETNRINQLVLRQTLQTTRDDSIFALGDCASCPRPGFPQPVPPRAQAAGAGRRRPAARRFRLPRLRLARVARQIHHRRQSHGFPGRPQFLHRGLFRAPDVSQPLQDARGGAARPGAHAARPGRTRGAAGADGEAALRPALALARAATLRSGGRCPLRQD